MATRVASLYAEFSADTTKFKAGANQVKTGMQSMKASMSSLVAGVSAASVAIVGVGVALKKGFDLAEAGAELEYTRARFNRLADGIGTDSRSLLADLTSVSSGMMSQAELMQSAGDLMALGLANTHDEAVRLTRVAAALNMNMNQLVLTLTNRTTARFDTLNVKVDGFKEKLEELEAQGYSTEAAFTEAFLQQAEAQIELVGDAANESIGEFKKFRATIADGADALKSLSVTIGGPVISSLNRQADHVERVTLAYANGKINLLEYIGAYYNLVDVMDLLPKVAENNIQRVQELAGALGGMKNFVSDISTEIETVIRPSISYDLSSVFGGQDLGLDSKIIDFTKNIDYDAAGGAIVNDLFTAVQNRFAAGQLDPQVAKDFGRRIAVENYAALVESGNAEATAAAQTLAKTYADSYKGYYTEHGNEIAAQIQELTNAGLDVPDDLKQQLSDEWVSAYQLAFDDIRSAMEGEDFINMDDINEALLTTADEFGVISDMINQMGPDSANMASTVSESMMSIAESSGMEMMLSRALEFQNRFTLPRHQYTTVHVSEVYGKNGSSGANSTYNDPRNNKPGGFAGGADFIVPSGFQTDNFPFYAQSGERVKVTPSGQVGGEGAKLAAAVDRLRRDMALLPEQIMSRQVLG